jgi:hypothetical protein
MKIVTFPVAVLVIFASAAYCEDSRSQSPVDPRPPVEVLWLSENPECPIESMPPPWGSEDEEPFTFKAGGNVTEPILKSKGPLDKEKYRECTGTVQSMPVMELVINRSGSVEAILLVRGEKNCWLDELVKYYRTWLFEPATKDGMPVCILFIITIRVGLQ